MKLLLNVLLLVSLNCFGQVKQTDLGAAQTSEYLHLLQDKRIGLIVNQTAQIADIHLVDMLLENNINVAVVFAPEHGFRGNKGAGETITDGVDSRTGIPIVSLYGKQKKPTPEMLKDIDILVFDIQDVGVRFYTYISTMHYVLEAGAQNGIPVLILDRPNPNIQHIAGPVLELSQQSFVGMHPIPILHGLTVGELAHVIKGENWIEEASSLDLTVIPVRDYDAGKTYDLPIAPSPNLPNAAAIQYYASLCLLEPTTFSVGRGTDFPFQIVGHPRVSLEAASKTITPRSLPHSAPTPKWQDQAIFATQIYTFRPQLSGFDTSILEQTYRQAKAQDEAFFTSPAFFDKLAGTASVRETLERGDSLASLEKSWQKQINDYRLLVQKYFLYPRPTKREGPSVKE